jgi:Cyclin, N-terminal domain/Cyclin, C-terminal domain
MSGFCVLPVCADDSSYAVDEIVDIIEVMQIQESTVYCRKDYLTVGSCSKVVDATWRQRIVEWMFGVVDHCSLRRDSVAIAAYYLDLCVERGVVASRVEFQLAAMTALQLAIKLYDSTVVKLDSMIKLGRGLFTEQDVIDMESKMLGALNWHVHPPTPICFLRQYLRVLPPSVSPLSRYVIAEVTRFIAEISVCLYKFVDSSSSIIAYSGMLIAMEKIDPITLPIWQRHQIYETMSKMANLDFQSPAVVDITTRLKVSLEKNVSLQCLMNTIDAQCRAEGYFQLATTATMDTSQSSTTSVVGSFQSRTTALVQNKVPINMNSPRDVFVTATPSVRR